MREDIQDEGAVLVRDLGTDDPGRVTKANEACVSPLDRGFLYGDAVFETLRCYNGEPALIEEHTSKLNHALEELSIPAELSVEDLHKINDRLLKEIQQEVDGSPDAYVRVSVTRGERSGLLSPTEQSPTLVCIAKTLETRRYEPASTEVVDVQRPEGVLASLKTHNYLPNVLAKMDSETDEAIMLGPGGRIASGAVSNLFVLRDGRLCTPAEHIRKGVTRGFVLETARHLGLATRVGVVESLDDVDAAFLTNSTWGVRPVKCIGNKELELDNQWVNRLAEEYFSHVIH